LFSFFFISLSFHFLVIQSFSSDTKGKKKIQGQPNTETIGDYMMNTKEDGRCHPPHVDPFDVQCKAFYVSVCLVLHCVGYSTERDVCTTNGGKKERRIEEKEGRIQNPLFAFSSGPYVYMIVVRRRERNETLWPNIVPSDHSRFSRSFVTLFSSTFQDYSVEYEKNV
jgi:hypothetical protein